MFAMFFQASTPAPQSLHVTAVEDHIRTKDEASFSQPLHTIRVTGTIGRNRYRLDEAAVMAYHFEVGNDYAVLKLKAGDRRIDIGVVDKQGRERKETLTIEAVEEVSGPTP